MKQTQKTFWGMIAPIAIGMILLASCQNALNPQPQGNPGQDGLSANGKGIALVRLGDFSNPAARTILPTDIPTFSRYVLNFTPGEENSGSADPVEVTGTQATALTGGSAVQVELGAGDWTVTVEGYQTFTTDETREYLAAEGSNTLTVRAGETRSVAVTINPLGLDTTSAKGVFSYEIALPASLTEATLTLTPVPSGTPITANLLTDETGVQEVSAGQYGLAITLQKGGLSAGVSESVHIYPGLESKAELDLSGITFANVVYLAGTVSATIPAGVSEFTVSAYEDDAYSDPITDATTTVSAAGAWLIEVPVSYIGQAVYVKAVANFVAGYAASTGTVDTATVASLPANGKPGVILSVAVRAPVTGVSLDKDAATLYVGGATETLTATIAPDFATNQGVTWHTSDSAVATVTDGVVSAVGPGSATITVKSAETETFTDTCTVTVVANLTAASVSGLVAPVIDATPVVVGALSPGSGNYAVESITWKKTADNSTLSGNFGSATQYYAEIVLKANEYYRFNGTITPAANTGTPAEGTITGNGSENTLTFKVTFPATKSGDSSISDLKVNGGTVGGTNPNFTITVDRDVTSATISLTKHTGATAQYKLGDGDYGTSATLSGLVAGENMVTVKITAEAGGFYVTEYTITVTRNAGTVTDDSDDLTISFWVNESDNAILSSLAATTVYKTNTGGGRPANFTASLGTDYTITQWRVDGVDKATTASITINAANYYVGTHRLGVQVTKDGKSYSTEITFTVAN